MEERLVSILILEHKIKSLGGKNKKDIDKLVFDYETKITNNSKYAQEQIV